MSEQWQTQTQPIQLPPKGAVSAKNPAIAVVLALIIRGLGHVYAARLAWGFFYFIGNGIAWLIFWLGFGSTPTDNTTASLLLWFLVPLTFYITNVVHAYTSVRRFNKHNLIQVR